MRPEPEETELQAFVDGRLDRQDRERVQAWLDANPRARERVEGYRRDKADLQRRLAEFSDGVDDAGTGRLAETLAARLEPRPRQTWWPRAAAAVVVFAVGWGSGAAYDSYRHWIMPPVVIGAAKAHEVFAEDNLRPVELPASASHELSDWFADHLDAPVEIPDLDGIGLAFIGGRLLTTEQGPLAQMLYEDRQGRRLSFYISTEETDSGLSMQVAEVNGFTAGYWKDENMVYTLVADTTREELVAIAAEMGVE